MSQSKLSEALALTLMRYKEIDRDTIEALCKRAASLEQQTGDALSINAALSKSHTQLQWALRDLLAQTRDLNDCYPEDDGYQSEALRNAIDTADALVGTDVTDQFPIADEPLNRRIQELEVALAEEKKKKQGNVFIGKDMLNIKQDGITRVQVGPLEVDRKWSEEALRLVIKKVMAEREAEIADKFQETQAQLDHINDTIASAMRDSLTKLPKDFELHNVVTVNGPDEATAGVIKDIIREEMQPGGRIHAALMR